MDKSASPITGYVFSKRIIDYYGAGKEPGAGNVLLESATNQWCDWLIRYDSFYLKPEANENKDRFDSILKDVCALYNTRGGVIIVEIEGNTADGILKNRGLQDYAKEACDQMCKYNTLLRTKDERRRIRRLFETKVICCEGREAIAILVKTVAVGQRYPLADNTNRFYVRDEGVDGTRLATGLITANSEQGESWRRDTYLNRDDLERKLKELRIPLFLTKQVSFWKKLRTAFRQKYSAQRLFSALIRFSRFGFVVMTLVQFLPISYEVCRGDNSLSIGHALKIFVVGIIPFVAPYWAAQGTIHSLGELACVSYLIYFWPYILYASACLFMFIDSMAVKRETAIKVGKVILLAAGVSVCVGLCIGYVAAKNRIRSIGGYKVSREEIECIIGIDELIVRSVEAVESKAVKKYEKDHLTDIYGVIKRTDYDDRLSFLQMVKSELMRVEAMYAPVGGNRTKLVDVLGEPDQGLIDCLSALSKALDECIKSYNSEGFDMMWQKANLKNREFFERAKEIGVYSKGSRL